MNIKTAWLKRTPKSRQEEFKKKVLAAKEVLDELNHIIEDEIQSSERNQLDQKNYDMPGWPYFQADQIGYKRALKTIKSYLEFE